MIYVPIDKAMELGIILTLVHPDTITFGEMGRTAASMFLDSTLEVVTCRDCIHCKHYVEEGKHECGRTYTHVSLEDFCSKGDDGSQDDEGTDE